MFVQKSRPIGKYEETRLRRAISRHQKTLRAQPRRMLGCLLGLTILPALVVILKPGDPVNRWGSLIFLGVLAALVGSIAITNSVEVRQRIRQLEQALTGGSVVETTVTSSSCFVLSALDNEGSEYFFDVGDQGTVCVDDHDFETRRFPNSNFTVKQIQSSNEYTLISWIVCKGNRLEPLRQIPKDSIQALPDFPHLVAIPGSLEDRLREMSLDS
jgi:hypothetical protein